MDINEERRNRFLKTLISEAVINVLAEQEEMQQQAAPASQPQQPEQPPVQPDNQPQQTRPVDEEFTVDLMIERLNTLRGGRSFTDPEIYSELSTFFNNLDDEKRSLLEDFLNDIGRIVVGIDEDEGLPQNQQQPEPTPSPQPTQAPAQQSTPPQQTQQAPSAPITPGG